jgi:predicted amidohydrolase
MKREVQVAAVQFNIQLGDIDANVNYVRGVLPRLAEQGCRLAVLPEMWSCGFAYRELNELAKRAPEVVEEMGRLSREYGMVLVGSVPEPDGDSGLQHRLQARPGSCRQVPEDPPIFLANEDRAFSGGDSWLVADTSVGRIGVFICCDLPLPGARPAPGGGGRRSSSSPANGRSFAGRALANPSQGAGHRKPALRCRRQLLRIIGSTIFRRQPRHRPEGGNPR